jgi:hypothetical protein
MVVGSMADFFPDRIHFLLFISVIPVILDRMNTSSTDTLFILLTNASVVNILTRCTWFALFYLLVGNDSSDKDSMIQYMY